MNKILFDTGIEEYEIGGGILRFNASDVNLYGRFFRVEDKILEIERELENVESSEDSKTSILALEKADQKMKGILSEVFGKDNDFNVIFQGVNCMAVGKNGERIITNFLTAITPIIKAGAERAAKAEARDAVAKATLNRARRRALK